MLACRFFQLPCGCGSAQGPAIFHGLNQRLNAAHFFNVLCRVVCELTGVYTKCGVENRTQRRQGALGGRPSVSDAPGSGALNVGVSGSQLVFESNLGAGIHLQTDDWDRQGDYCQDDSSCHFGIVLRMNPNCRNRCQCKVRKAECRPERDPRKTSIVRGCVRQQSIYPETDDDQVPKQR